MSSIILNQDQELASSKIIDFIDGKTNLPYFTLTGGPGTGKTIMLYETLLRTNNYLFSRSAAAVAHAAKNVLDTSFKSSIPCFTVAQWLGLKMVYSETGEILFSRDPKGVPKLNMFKIAVLDEASMIHDSLYDDIMTIVTNYGIKLIVVGELLLT
jgi:hypothetical protein